jgi:hypothetical protein
MTLMAVLLAIMVVGVVATIWWGATPYRPWPSPNPDEADPPPLTTATRRVLRGAAVGLVGGFWTGILVTGPAIRLVMRLLAVTAGDDAQGRLTEADEVVGVVSVDGTIGLIIFGGLFAGLVSGLLYAAIRHWLPSGRLGGVVFGCLHLLVAATRIDPLRPENPDFDIVGPGWLSVTTFVLACLLHGMAVAAFANRYSHELPPAVAGVPGLARAIVPPAPAVVVTLAAAVFLVPVIVVMALVAALSQSRSVVRFARSRAVLVGGRVVLALLALALLPFTLRDLGDVVVRAAG